MIISRRTSGKSIANRTMTESSDLKNSTDIYLYGDIGGYFGIDSKEWIQELNSVKSGDVHIRIDSVGGDVFSARAMKTAMMQHKSKIIAHIDGVAASAASFLAMGADEIEIVEGGFLMIHDAMSYIDIYGYYNKKDMSMLVDELGKEINLLTKMDESIAKDYVDKSGAELKEVLGWMNEETWFTAEEALEKGLVDRVYTGKPVEASYDLSIFAKAPDVIVQRNKRTSKRIIEKAMRDAGITDKEAKAILSEGYKGIERDVQNGESSSKIDIFERDVQSEADENGSEDISNEEDVKTHPGKKDRINELLIRASKIAPSQIGKNEDH